MSSGQELARSKCLFYIYQGHKNVPDICPVYRDERLQINQTMLNYMLKNEQVQEGKSLKPLASETV